MNILNYTLVDAAERQCQFPASFQAPSAEDIARVKVGDCVKVGAEFEGEVNNNLVCTDLHGLACGQLIRFQARHILSVSET
ncbi:hypothetical protein [Roseomonas sp. WA12]